MSARSSATRPFVFRPVMTVIAAALLLLAGTLAAGYQYRQRSLEQRRQLTVQANILAASVTAAITFNDRPTAQEYVNALMLDPRLDAVAVYNEWHQRVAGFQRDDAEPIPDLLAHGGPLPHDLVTVPARQGDTVVGSVYLRAAATPPLAQLARFSGVALLTIMALLLISALAVAQRTLTRANAALQRRARQLTHANRRLSAEMEQRARTEEALRQSQKMEAIGQLSGGIAHDFNNLLMIISTSLSRLRQKIELALPAHAHDAGSGEAHVQVSAPPLRTTGGLQVGRYLDMAQQAVDKAASLTQRLLSFARQQSLAPQPLHLDALIEDIGPLLEQSAGPSVHIEYRLASRWQVVCDPNQMESAILNLVINARDAMASGGQITVATEDRQLVGDDPGGTLAPGDYVCLQVADTGAGMSEDVRSKAFDPFFTTKPVGKGTGLGLSTILGYVVQSRGAAFIDSQPGRGTTVSLLLPRASDETPRR